MDFNPFASVSVIGAGAWGTALAHLCASNGVETLIWSREPEVAATIANRCENEMYLPGESLHPALRATAKLSETVSSEAFLFVTPAQYARPVLSELHHFASEKAPVALCSKGVEVKTGLLMTEVMADVWPGARPAVLSGPSFARDVVRGLPTAVTLACAEAALAQRWAATLGAAHFRPYLSDDLVGAELGGAVKNVLAIAAGVVDGRGLGESARAALIARGFAEFQRLGVALGAKTQTMAGLSGLGDLILTANSPHSRNMSLGVELGKGRVMEDVLSERSSVSEGVATAGAVMALAQKAGVDMPICQAVAKLVAGSHSVDALIADLLARPIKPETK
ncbi:MAG: NAD(P)H-dependent glycerol-3-phosphate dehydrogenase [Pseudomonadota bacterium]